MKVRATKLGFYGNRRRYEGDEFELGAEGHFSKTWMKRIGVQDGQEIQAERTEVRPKRKPKGEESVI